MKRSLQRAIPDNALAIVGMAGRFPGANDVAAFWQNLAHGIKSIRALSDNELLAAGVDRELLKAPNYVKKAALLDDIELFDAPFFGYTPREAETLDPQTRLFLQCAWVALEHAGYTPEISKDLIGVFAGKGFPSYMWRNLCSNPEFVQLVGEVQLGIHNETDSLAPIVAYKLDLKGPSISVQSFCSTSMLAVHLACQSLLGFECDMALAGGVSLAVPHGEGYLYQEGGILSPDGECRSLDIGANGSVWGSGVGVVALKRLEDALEDGACIYAIIRGSTTNNDGMLRVGYTAPGVNGEAAAMLEALSAAGVSPETISYIQTHGTGTPLGDSIELEAMIQAFGRHTTKTGFCAIGSIKPNVGHLDRAAGIANVIATALSLYHKQLPPSVNFEKTSPEIDLASSPFYVNTKLQEWTSDGRCPRRAGVSSFGLGGTNVHMIMEEAPPQPPSSASRPYQLLLLSAKTEGALEIATSNLAEYLRNNSTVNLADVAFTMQVGRVAMNHRRIVVCHDAEDGINALSMADPNRVFSANQTHRNRWVTFLFPGVGDHYVDMGRDLYDTEPVFRMWIDRCNELLTPALDQNVRDVLYPAVSNSLPATTRPTFGRTLSAMLGREPEDAAGPLQQTVLAQPAVFIVEYALAQLLIGWGIRPQAVIGYSLGEYVAACVAGVLSLEDALHLVASRARLIQSLPPGAMLAVMLRESEVQPLLSPGMAVSGALTPTSCVVAGPVQAIAALRAQLEAREIVCRSVPATHAFHSPMMVPIVDAFAAEVNTVVMHPPQIPYLSNLTGRWVTDAEVTDPTYWTRHLCQTVRFADGIAELLQNENQILLEVGPGKALGSFVKQHPAFSRQQPALVGSTIPHVYEPQSAAATLLNVLGKLWLAGVLIDWKGFYEGERRRRVALPTYPFARMRYWINPQPIVHSASSPGSGSMAQPNSLKKANLADWFYKSVWKKTPLGPATPTKDRWLIFTDDLGLGDQIAEVLRCQGRTVISVAAGDQFVRYDAGHFTIHPEQLIDYRRLIEALAEANAIPEKIVHLRSVSRSDVQESGPPAFAAAQQRGFYNLLYLMQALSAQNVNDPIEVVAVSSNAQPVLEREALFPEKATIFGICRSIIQEGLTVKCSAVDLDVPAAGAWPIPTVVEQLVAELSAPIAELEVAYRADERYVRTFEAIALEAQATSRLRTQGTYLITGGLGGVGQILADYLAKTYKARLVLCTRSAFPERLAWDRWLAEHADTNSVSQAIRRIHALEALGADLLVVQADAADEAQMRRAVALANARFGQIHGVLHAAGISSREAFDSIQNIGMQQCEWHFQPKVYGLYVLEKVLAGLPLDFCLLFSSVSSVLGGLGFVGYTAANIFMDTFTHHHNRGSDTRWLSVNWDTWPTRQHQHEEFSASTVAAYEMTEAEGAQAFERVLMYNAESQVIESTGDLFSRIRQWIMLESLDTAARAIPSGHARPELPTRYIPADSDYERRIAAVWQRLLGIDRVGINDNFFDLGGNSLVGLQVIASLKSELSVQIPVVALFEAPTVGTLARYLKPDGQTLDEEEDNTEFLLSERRQKARRQDRNQDIAILSMNGRFPGARNIDEFWNNLCQGVESITFFTEKELLESGIDPQALESPNYIRARPTISDTDAFDAGFFGYSPREIEYVDPQHRLFLECSWEALESAGYNPKQYKGLIGVFGGAAHSVYMLNWYSNPELSRSVSDAQAMMSGDRDSLTTTVSYKLNLRGPSLAVQTFCSTSLVATHLACQSLLNGECDMALAGGVSISVPQKRGYAYQEGGQESPDGHCRTFDERAQGTLFGDGIGVVLLKRLEDALTDGDTIHAVIKSSAINNDGSLKVGYAAPSVVGQAEAVRMALDNSGIHPETIGYVEAHGTGTELGDPIEVASLTRAFRLHTDKVGFCGLGSVKPNVGHLDRAAGVANLIKAALAVKHGLIPPTLHFCAPNPEIDFATSPFYVVNRLQQWPSVHGSPRRAGVNALGMGGTNAHVILEEPPPIAPSSASRPAQLLLLSARSEIALETATANLAHYIRQNSESKLADLAYTLQVGRCHFEHRRMAVCHNAADALEILEGQDPRRLASCHQPEVTRPIAFLFPGVGDHYLHMGRGLYEAEPLFRDIVDQCSRRLLAYLGDSLPTMLYPAEDEKPTHPRSADNHSELLALQKHPQAPRSPAEVKIHQTAFAQPIVFVIEYAIARLLMSWGLRPRALLGYSLGEYTAACLAGVLSLDDALKLVAERARLIQSLPLGKMLAVCLPLPDLESYLSPEVSLAAHNGPQTCILAGLPDAIDRVAERLTVAGIACRPLETTHAFHSHMMDILVEPFTGLARSVRFQPPRIPYLSNLTGTWITPAQATDPAYWAQHLSQTVQFSACLETLLQTKDQVLLEVGPGRSLGSFAKLHPACSSAQLPLILSTLPAAHERDPDLAFLLGTLGRLWLAGVQPDWDSFYANETRHRLPLPTYPFERQSFWLQPDRSPFYKHRDKRGIRSAQEPTAERLPFEDWFYRPVWNQSGPRAPVLPQGPSTWLIFADAEGWGQQVAMWLREHDRAVVVVRAASAFDELADTHYLIDPRRREDYDDLLASLKQRKLAPSHILHMWNLVPRQNALVPDDFSLENALDTGFYSLMFLVQALGELDLTACQLSVIAAHAHMVTGAETVWPTSASLIGTSKVIPQEYPRSSCRFIDASLPTRHTWQAEAFFNNLLGEVLSADFTDTIVALRGHQRWVERFERQSLASLNEHGPALLRLQGVYLITGGLGGIGLALAEHLAQTVQAKLVLVGRTAMPPRTQWAQLLAEHGPDKGMGYKIQRIQRLEELGAEVLLVTADVSNLSQVQMAVQQAMDRFGAVHGVFHAAGVPGVGLVQLKTRETMAQVLAPKVTGTVVLERALENIALDFLVLFSSVSAITGAGPGQFGYASANSFLDAYAVSHQGEKRLTVSIGWNEWQWNAWDEGLDGFSIDVQAALRANRMKYGISFAEGSKAIDLILASRLPHVIVSPLEFNQVVHSSRNFTVERVLNFGREQHKSRPRYPRPTLGTSYVAPHNEVEQQIADLWGELLGISDVGVLDNFFDLGGNSLVGLDMIARLKRELNVVKIPAHAIYEAPSVREMARFLNQDQSTKKISFQKRLERGEKRRQAVEQQSTRKER